MKNSVLFGWINPKPLPAEERRIFSDKALKAMIVPLVIEQLLQLVVGIADTMMVSYAGEATVSGVSLDAQQPQPAEESLLRNTSAAGINAVPTRPLLRPSGSLQSFP